MYINRRLAPDALEVASALILQPAARRTEMEAAHPESQRPRLAKLPKGE
jgi:hypothetical protein